MQRKSTINTIGSWILRIGVIRGMMSQLQLGWLLFRDNRVPLTTKAIPVIAALLIVTPLNLVFEVIPIIGQMDTLAIVAFGLQAFIRAAPQEIVQEYQMRLSGPQR